MGDIRSVDINSCSEDEESVGLSSKDEDEELSSTNSSEEDGRSSYQSDNSGSQPDTCAIGFPAGKDESDSIHNQVVSSPSKTVECPEWKNASESENEHPCAKSPSELGEKSMSLESSKRTKEALPNIKFSSLQSLDELVFHETSSTDTSWLVPVDRIRDEGNAGCSWKESQQFQDVMWLSRPSSPIKKITDPFHVEARRHGCSKTPGNEKLVDVISQDEFHSLTDDENRSPKTFLDGRSKHLLDYSIAPPNPNESHLLQGEPCGDLSGHMEEKLVDVDKQENKLDGCDGFDDASSWSSDSMEVLPDGANGRTSPPKVAELRQEAGASGESNYSFPHVYVPVSHAECSLHAKSPVSKLVQSVYSNCRRQKGKKEAQVFVGTPLPEVNDNVSALEKRLKEMDSELSLLKRENKKLEKLVKENDSSKARLAQDKAQWEHQKALDIQAFDAYKTEQMQQLKRERKFLEKQSNLLLLLPTKKERKEIQDLKSQLSQKEEEVVKKESRWRLTTRRLRKVIEELTGQIHELQSEIKRYEMQLIMQWDQQEIYKLQGKKVPALPGTIGEPDKLLAGNAKKVNHGSDAGEVLEHGSEQNAGMQLASEECKDTRLCDEYHKCNNATEGEEKHRAPQDCSTEDTAPGIVSGEGNNGVSSVNPSARGTSRPVNNNSILGSYKGTEGYAKTINEQKHDVEDQQTVNARDPKLHATGYCRSRRQSHVFLDGTREEAYQDGLACIYFPNGDIQNNLPDGTIEYYYYEVDAWHTTKPNGVQIFYLPNHQVEEHWPNGEKKVIYPKEVLRHKMDR